MVRYPKLQLAGEGVDDPLRSLNASGADLVEKALDNQREKTIVHEKTVLKRNDHAEQKILGAKRQKACMHLLPGNHPKLIRLPKTSRYWLKKKQPQVISLEDLHIYNLFIFNLVAPVSVILWI